MLNFIEAIAIYWPLALCLSAFFLSRPRLTPRHFTAAMMSTTWLIATLPWVNHFAALFNYWDFSTQHHYQILNLPLSFYLGWIILWGILPALIPPIWEKSNLRLFLLTLIFILLDLATMPLLDPVLKLSQTWYTGEALLILICLIPSLFLSKWVITDTQPTKRAFTIALAFVTILFTIVPKSQTYFQFKPIENWLEMNQIQQNLILFLHLVILTPAIAAILEFSRIGKGTPIPQDPPKQLVTTSVYSYVKNPMQLCILLTGILWAIVFSSLFYLIAIILIVYCLGIAQWSENLDLNQRYRTWRTYKQTVPSWLPSLTPHWIHEKPAVLYIDHLCPKCHSIAQWFNQKKRIALNIEQSKNWPKEPLNRITYYDPNLDKQFEGVLAISRAFQHLHIAYAWVGWLISLPFIQQITQAAMDASGAAPQNTQPKQHTKK